jgi:tetratricopeptide (TPR) repeat protein
VRLIVELFGEQVQGADVFAMQRPTVFPRSWLLLWLLLAQPGCSWIGLRRDLDNAALTTEQANRTQQLSETAQEALDRGDYEQARLVLLQLVAQAPDSAESQQKLGKVFQLEGRLPEAEACYRIALQRDRDYPEALIGLGQVEAQRADTASALKRFETAIEIDPHRPEAHFSLGCVLEAIGRTDEALAEYFRAVEVESNNPKVSLRIAAIQLNRNQPDQALSRLDRVLELAAESAEGHDLRGRAHLTLRHFPQAVEDFRKAVSLVGDRPDLYYRLALALEANHQPGDAFRAAEHALRLAPDFADARVLSQRLALAVSPGGNARLQLVPDPLPRRDSQPPAEPAR